MQPRLDRALALPGANGDLADRQVFNEAEDHHDAVVRTERRQGLSDRDSLRGIQSGVDHGNVERARHGLSHSLPKPIPAPVDQDSVEPGVELAGGTQASPSIPCLLGGILDRVFGLAGVSENGCGESIRPVEPF
ncbi:MAG TPA: hypothetical protein VIK06_03940 [Candidatus Limnocylindrales bacterium]